VLGRPPPWLAFPPLLAISRCFAGSMAAKPRFAVPVLVVGMTFSRPQVAANRTLIGEPGSQC
jgi:hypothetical protein